MTSVLSLLAVLLVAVPAANAAESGLSRCMRGTAPDVDVILDHEAGVRATNWPLGDNPPNGVGPGDAVTIYASGWIYINSWPVYEVYGPSGKAEIAPQGYPVPGMRKYASLWRWNHNPTGWVGEWGHTSEFGTCRAAPSVPARLIFLINDDVTWDNTGSFRLWVKVWKSR
ncbi:hypothetical protein ACIGPN_28850 [Streptomyces afghaniensis]|uniref:hypothetical protein n=1 Tax=Streptomyces afghaniensis TaxID=66865 RepID=UPI0037D36822